MALRVVLIALLAALFQPAQPRPATLVGHVVRAGSSVPVAHARVVVARVGGDLSDYHTLTTGPDGRFAFAGIAPGVYRIYATHDGYLQAELGRRPSGSSGVPVSVVEGQSSGDLEIAMTPTGVISGHVLLLGEPVRNSIVRALKSTYSDGERHFTVADWAQTDDRGEYRLFGLAPGRYVVSAVAPARPRIEGDWLVTSAIPSNANGNSQTERTPLKVNSVAAAAFDRATYPTVYHPGTIDANGATAIDLRGGETVMGIDLGLSPSQTVHLRGKVSVTDTTAKFVSVSLEARDTPYTLPRTFVQADASGTFDIGGVVPGRYYLSAQATGARGGPPLYAVVPVDVGDRESAPISIALGPGVTIAGHVTVDGAGIEPDRPPIIVELRGVQARGACCWGTGYVGPDGRFQINNVVPHEYRLIVRQPGTNFWVKSARFGGEDALAGPVRVTADLTGRELEIALDTHTATLGARVVDAELRPQAGVLVVAVPAHREDSSAYRSATTGADGRVHMTGIAPGRYTVFASDSIPAATWLDPDVVRAVEASGTPAEFHESEMKPMTLRIVR